MSYVLRVIYQNMTILEVIFENANDREVAINALLSKGDVTRDMITTYDA